MKIMFLNLAKAQLRGICTLQEKKNPSDQSEVCKKVVETSALAWTHFIFKCKFKCSVEI